MQYRIVRLRVNNFKCFDDAKYYEFNVDIEKNPVILSGPNGFGKTTFFDAIELIFSKNITRLDTNIESKKTNLGKNLLLNQSDKDGTVVLELVNEEGSYLTLFARIKNNVHQIDIEKSVKYGYVDRILQTDEIDEFLERYSNWSDTVNHIETLRYRADNFNVYYYVSQAESVHFLKRTISERKDAMNVLLNTESVSSRISRIEEIIGKQANAKGALINDLIRETESTIATIATKLKVLISQQAVPNAINSQYVSLGLYELDNTLFSWDSIDISNKDSAILNSCKLKVDSIISLLTNWSDYNHYLKNNEIKTLIADSHIDDYIRYKRFIVGGHVNDDKLQEEIFRIDSIIQLFACTVFFRNETVDVDLFNPDDINKIKVLIPKTSAFDFALIQQIVDEIKYLKKMLSDDQKLIDRIISARKALDSAFGEYAPNSNICPFCNTEFEDNAALSNGYSVLDELLKEKSEGTIERIKKKSDELKVMIDDFNSKFLVDKYSEEDIQNMINAKTLCHEFLIDTGRKNCIEKISKIIGDIEIQELNEAAKRVVYDALSEKMLPIDSETLEEEMQQYSFENIVNEYGDLLNYIRTNIEIEQLRQKAQYILSLIKERDNTEVMSLRQELSAQIVRKKSMQDLRTKLYDLKKVYENAIDRYKNMTLEKLRVPLLIYTGKILQDYQNGLGVFVNKDEMRFVSNGDAKHDILNTFSSGQLSGFVLAFLFAMNKRYINVSSDSLGFILVDDPVQTMDDINIASLIEVLRNDFSGKQVIISTHEEDKENYILYKFYKYGQMGQSLNVKEEIYGI